jgi:hypothetical protein
MKWLFYLKKSVFLFKILYSRIIESLKLFTDENVINLATDLLYLMKVPFFYKIIPKKIRLKRLKNQIVKYLENKNLSPDEKVVLDYYKTNPMTIFPYDFPKAYKPEDIKVEKDATNGLFYMLWEGKKLYFKNGKSKYSAQVYFNSLLLEQDSESPHRYLGGEFDVQPGDVILDVGAAEGNFSLSVIEKIKHAYIFEVEEEWINALRATFEPWKDKVTIIKKYVSDHDDQNCLKLDTFFDSMAEINFIKADVEGAEAEIIKGAASIIKSQKNLKIALCTYHRQTDAEVLKTLIESMGFQTSFSKNYMVYHYGKTNVVEPPYLRKAILRAIKK